MATRTQRKKATKSTYDVVKANTKKWNKEFMNTTMDVVEGTIESGSQWQEILAKGLKGSTKLIKKQQDLMLNTLEGVKKQVDTDVERYTKLLGLEKLAERGNEVVKSIKNFAPKLTDRVEDTVEKAQKTVKKVSKSADKMMDVVEDKAEEMVKATKKMVNAEMVTDKPVNTDLKVIDGIGPKMEIILNNAGIKTITQLKKTKAADLKAILEAAGPRYKMFNPQFWIDQAKNL